MRYNCRIMSAWLKKQRENLIFCCTFETVTNWIGRFWSYILGNYFMAPCSTRCGVEIDDSADELLSWSNIARGMFLLQPARCRSYCLRLLLHVFTWQHVWVKQRISYGRSQFTVLTVLPICVYWPLAFFCFFSFWVSYSYRSVGCLYWFVSHCLPVSRYFTKIHPQLIQ